MIIRNYVGARYVPKFADPVEWQANTSYEAMVIVTYNNSSYTSKIPVPPTVGNPAENSMYWALTGNYNAQVEQYRQETGNYNAQVEEYRKATANAQEDINELKTKTGTNTNDIAKISNNLTAHINANNPHHISKATIGLEKLQNVEYLPKQVLNCPQGDALNINYWINLGTGLYFVTGLKNLPVDYAFAFVYTHDGFDALVILYTQHSGRTFIMTGNTINHSDWIEFAMKNNADAKADKTEIINTVYPVGSIYMSVNSTSPASLFGGTWEPNKAGSTGGEATLYSWKRTA